MSHFSTLLTILLDHWDTCLQIFLFILSLLKITQWGHSKSQALDLVTKAIEDAGDKAVKNKVTDLTSTASPAVKDSIDTSVAIADPKKKPLDLLIRIARELLRIK